jgi:hypothetical protein
MRRRVSAAAAAVAAVLAATAVGTAVAADSVPPDTSILEGPENNSTDTTPTFSFTSTEPGTFECSLDGAAYAPCTSPYTTLALALGQHTFAVRARDADGNVDPSPATRSWTGVPPLDAPVVTLTAPAGKSIRRARLRALAGTASAPSGITRVQLAMQVSGSRSDDFIPRCRFADLTSGAIERGFCGAPPRIDARGTTRWRHLIPRAARKRLPRGRYVVLVRAVNGYGRTTTIKRRLRVR